MPRPSLRTRSRKRVSLRLPGSRTVVHFKKERAKPPHCPFCGRVLHGIPYANPSEVRKFSLSERRVERIFGGHLCSRCLKDLLKRSVRTL